MTVSILSPGAFAEYVKNTTERPIKRVAKIINKNWVHELCVCPCCDATHIIKSERDEFEDYMNNGPHPSVGKYEGWDEALELLCDGCEKNVKNLIGEEWLLSLYRDGEPEFVEHLAQCLRERNLRIEPLREKEIEE